MKNIKVLPVNIIALFLFVAIANATPSTQIWIPSTDVQPFKKMHLGIDTYIKTQSRDGTTEPTVTNIGLTMGVLPSEKIQGFTKFPLPLGRGGGGEKKCQS